MRMWVWAERGDVGEMFDRVAIVRVVCVVLIMLQ